MLTYLSVFALFAVVAVCHAAVPMRGTTAEPSATKPLHDTFDMVKAPNISAEVPQNATIRPFEGNRSTVNDFDALDMTVFATFLEEKRHTVALTSAVLALRHILQMGRNLKAILFLQGEQMCQEVHRMLESSSAQLRCMSIPSHFGLDDGSSAVLVDPVFAAVRNLSRSPILMYLRPDLLFSRGLVRAVQQAQRKLNQFGFSKFLLVGRRRDVLQAPLDLSSDVVQIDVQLSTMASSAKLSNPRSFDYLVFTRGIFEDRVPRLLLDRIRWDKWMVEHCLSRSDVAVVDATDFALALHVTHEEAPIPSGSHINLENAGHRYALADIAYAQYRFQRSNIGDNWAEDDWKLVTVLPHQGYLRLRRQMDAELWELWSRDLGSGWKLSQHKTTEKHEDLLPTLLSLVLLASFLAVAYLCYSSLPLKKRI